MFVRFEMSVAKKLRVTERTSFDLRLDEATAGNGGAPDRTRRPSDDAGQVARVARGVIGR